LREGTKPAEPNRSVIWANDCETNNSIFGRRDNQGVSIGFKELQELVGGILLKLSGSSLEVVQLEWANDLDEDLIELGKVTRFGKSELDLLGCGSCLWGD
jgi:hypothetical protein